MANRIHPTAIIDGAVELGSGNEIGAYSVIIGPTSIGDDNLISPFVTIGTKGQDTRNPHYDASNCRIEIGSRNIIREHSTVQKPAYEDLTLIGNDVHIMSHVHIPHDARISDQVVLTPMVVLAGLTRVMRGANIAIGSSVQQRAVIGHYAIVGMGSAVLRNIRPFTKHVQRNPPRVNEYAMKKFGFTDLSTEIEAYVVRGERPYNDRLLSIVNEYELICERQGG